MLRGEHRIHREQQDDERRRREAQNGTGQFYGDQRYQDHEQELYPAELLELCFGHDNFDRTGKV